MNTFFFVADVPQIRFGAIKRSTTRTYRGTRSGRMLMAPLVNFEWCVSERFYEKDWPDAATLASVSCFPNRTEPNPVNAARRSVARDEAERASGEGACGKTTTSSRMLSFYFFSYSFSRSLLFVIVLDVSTLAAYVPALLYS